MKRRLPVLLFVLTGILSLAAAEFDFLPDPVAKVDGSPIPRTAIVKRLRETELATGAGESERLKLARQAAETEIYYFLLSRLLKEEGITPSKEAATAQLLQFQKLLPRGIPGQSTEDLDKLASSEPYRYNVALQSYLARTAPELLKVEDAEVERVYRLNREKFLLPERYEFGMIRIPKSRRSAKDFAEMVRARLLQGEDFDRVARESDPDGSELPDAELIELLKQGNPALPVNSISRILENGEAYFIIKIKSKSPASYVPLNEISPYLRLQLASEKAGRAFELLLRRELGKANVEYYLKAVEK